MLLIRRYPVPHTVSRPHGLLAAGLVILAIGLGAVVGNGLGAADALIAALVVATRAVERPDDPIPATVEVEP